MDIIRINFGRTKHPSTISKTANEIAPATTAYSAVGQAPQSWADRGAAASDMRLLAAGD